MINMIKKDYEETCDPFLFGRINGGYLPPLITKEA
jgi:hypothetical protein